MINHLLEGAVKSMLIAPDFLLTVDQYRLLCTELNLRPDRFATHERASAESGQPPSPVELDVDDEVDTDRSDPELVALLKILGHHDLALDIAAHPDGVIRALGVVEVLQGALAVLDKGEVGLMAISRDDLVRSVVDALPEGDNGSDQVLTIPVDALRAAARLKSAAEADASDEELTDYEALVKVGLPSTDPGRRVELPGGALSRRVGLFAGTSAPRERTERILVTWFDTAQGRYLMVREGEWLTVVLAERALSEMLDSAVTSVESTE